MKRLVRDPAVVSCWLYTGSLNSAVYHNTSHCVVSVGMKIGLASLCIDLSRYKSSPWTCPSISQVLHVGYVVLSGFMVHMHDEVFPGLGMPSFGTA